MRADDWVRWIFGMGGAVALAACSGDDAAPADGGSSGPGATGDASSTMSSSGSDGPTTGPDPDTDDTDDTAVDTSGGETPPWSTSLEVDETVGAFLSVWGDGAAPLYVVGGQTGADMLTIGAVYRFDGRAWTPETLPDGTFGLNWVFGVDGHRFAVGDFGELVHRDGDAGTWTEAGCATTLPLWGVWGASADDVWIVGGDGFDRDPFLCHYDGVAFTAQTLPEPSFETHALFKVWGTAADDVYAVGDAGWIVHYDGVEWSEQPSGTTSDLISLWGASPTEIVAVGGRATGVLARFDGTGWTTTVQSDLPGLNGVFVDADGTATVVGALGVAGRVAPGDTTVEVEPTGTQLALHAVFGEPEGDLYGVGGSFDLAPPFVGIVVTRTP
jgi:hypothetical protein